MNQEPWFCPNHFCSVDAWLVQQCPDTQQLWQITDRFAGGPYTVAALAPVCPRCGTTLCAAVEIGPGLCGSDDLETGPMFDFIRSLR